MPTVSIYVSKENLELAQKESEERGISLSRVLSGQGIKLLGGDRVIDPSAEIFDRLDRIEEKVDLLVNPPLMMEVAAHEDSGPIVRPKGMSNAAWLIYKSAREIKGAKK